MTRYFVAEHGGEPTAKTRLRNIKKTDVGTTDPILFDPALSELERRGVKYVYDLNGWWWSLLLRLPNLGMKRISYLKDVCDKCGVTLNKDV